MNNVWLVILWLVGIAGLPSVHIFHRTCFSAPVKL